MHWNNNINILWGRENPSLLILSLNRVGCLGFFSKKHIENPQTVLQETFFLSGDPRKSSPCHQTQQQVFNLQAGASALTSKPPPAGLQLSPMPVQLPEAPGHIWRSGKASHKWHCTKVCQAKELTHVPPTCQPLGCGKHTEEQPGAELCLGHGSTAGAAAARSAAVPRLKPQQLAVASSLAAPGPSSLSWNGSIFLCFWSQPWEGLAIQLADPEGYFPSYFGNLEHFVVMFLAELFKISFQRLTFRCNVHRKLLVARNSTAYVCLWRREDPLVPSISAQCLCHILWPFCSPPWPHFQFSFFLGLKIWKQSWNVTNR